MREPNIEKAFLFKVHRLLLALMLGPQVGCAQRLLLAEDAVIPRGQPAELAAAVDEQALVIFTKGVPNTPVEFYLDKEKVGEARTDQEGRASANVGAREGTTTFTARAKVGNREIETGGRVYHWDPEQPAIAVDIDETLSLSEYINIIWGDGLGSRALPGSAEGVQQLAKDYQIIYYSIRPRFMYDRTRKWLEKKGFPDGPIIFTDSFHAAFHQTERKRRMLADLRSRWPNVEIGIGDKLTDVVACNDNQMLPIIVNSLLPKFKQHAIVVRDWKTLVARPELTERLAGRRRQRSEEVPAAHEPIHTVANALPNPDDAPVTDR